MFAKYLLRSQGNRFVRIRNPTRFRGFQLPQATSYRSLNASQYPAFQLRLFVLVVASVQHQFASFRIRLNKQRKTIHLKLPTKTPMNTAIQCFDFKENPVRILDQDGAPWFVAADVCRVLEIGNPRQAVRSLDDDEKMTVSSSDGHSGMRGGAQSYNIISESGLYALIFKSRKPQAKSFRKWVTSEVLPSLRRGGSYTVPGAPGAAAAIGGQVALVDYIQGRGLDVREKIRFGNLCKRLARAMGIRPTRELHPVYGEAHAYPAEIFAEVLKEMEPDQDDDIRDLVMEMAERMADGDSATGRDLMAMARTAGISLGQDCSVSSLGKRIGAFCGCCLVSREGQSFRITRLRTRYLRKYKITFGAAAMLA